MEIPIENRHLSKSLMEKILTIEGNPLVPHLYKLYMTEATGKGVKNITINTMGELTFLPKGKECKVSSNGNWSTDNRQSGSYGKVIRKVLSENGIKDFTDSDLEQMVNSLKALYDIGGTFEIVCGEDIRKFYHEENYCSSFNLGTMGSSCMRHGGIHQDSLSIYVYNSNVRMVILKSPEGLCRGRALLWTDREGDLYMDRIYGNDAVIKAFKNYARSIKAAHKESQTYSREDWVFPDGQSYDKDVYVDMEDTNYDIYPYMDTFKFVGRGEVSNDSGISYHVCADSVPEDQDDMVWDEVDQENIHEEEAVYIDSIPGWTRCDNARFCELTGEWFLIEDVVQTENGIWVYVDHDDVREINGRYYIINDLSECEYDNELYPNEEVRYVGDLEMSIHEDNVEEAYRDAGWEYNDENGEWLLKGEEDEVEG